MRIALQLSLVLVAAGIAAGTRGAPPVLAPPPHPALDELVKEYRRFGLPIPPPNGRLVRAKFWIGDSELGFEIPAAKAGENSSVLIGTRLTHAASLEPVKPTADVLQGIKPSHYSDFLCLAVQCRMRGYDELAAALYAHARESNMPELQFEASQYWKGKLRERHSNRMEILHYLKKTNLEKRLVRDLELTLAVPKSKPGSTERLVDELTEYWDSFFIWNDDEFICARRKRSLLLETRRKRVRCDSRSSPTSRRSAAHAGN